MRIRQFLEHHRIVENPFSDEDAQTDRVFQDVCIQETFHPAWDKIFGHPTHPATSVVFGEKGSGKTALKMQMLAQLAEHNAANPSQRIFVIRYDDFNLFLDRFAGAVPFTSKPKRVLGRWRIWDHMDAVLALGVTHLVDRVLETRRSTLPQATAARLGDEGSLPLENLDASQRRDLLLLAACYDQSNVDNIEQRWDDLRKKLRVSIWRAKWDVALGLLVTILALVLFATQGGFQMFLTIWPYVTALAGWLPRLFRSLVWYWRSRRIIKSTRVLHHSNATLRGLLGAMPRSLTAGQPLPLRRRTDARYELLEKFQGVLESLGFAGIYVLVDRVDEPHLLQGSPELMRLLVWPILDNKLLKHPGLGIKLLLPSELADYLDRENEDFHQKARLDKQNLVRSLEWTGQSLRDMANARIVACTEKGQTPPNLADLFDETIGQTRLTEALGSLRVPRHLFKFLYRLLVRHTNAHSEESPAWRISGAMFESELAVYQRDQLAMERDRGAG